MLTFKKILIAFSVMPLLSSLAMAEGEGVGKANFHDISVVRTINPVQVDRHIPLTGTDNFDITDKSSHHRARSHHNNNSEKIALPEPILETHNWSTTEKEKKRKKKGMALDNKDVSQYNKHRRNIKLKPNREQEQRLD